MTSAQTSATNNLRNWLAARLLLTQPNYPTREIPIAELPTGRFTIMDCLTRLCRTLSSSSTLIWTRTSFHFLSLSVSVWREKCDIANTWQHASAWILRMWHPGNDSPKSRSPFQKGTVSACWCGSTSHFVGNSAQWWCLWDHRHGCWGDKFWYRPSRHEDLLLMINQNNNLETALHNISDAYVLFLVPFSRL